MTPLAETRGLDCSPPPGPDEWPGPGPRQPWRLRPALRRLECRLGGHQMRDIGMQLGQRLEQCERCRAVRAVR